VKEGGCGWPQARFNRRRAGTECRRLVRIENHAQGREQDEGDERILGEGDFVETLLKAAQENLDRKSVIQSQGYDFGWLTNRVTDIFGLTPKELLTGGTQRKALKTRSVLCYWGTRELGLSAVEISKKLNIASSTASESVARGRQIAEEQGLTLLDEDLE
jgi:putative transposase